MLKQQLPDVVKVAKGHRGPAICQQQFAIPVNEASLKELL
jgi:hypothetical protein